MSIPARMIAKGMEKDGAVNVQLVLTIQPSHKITSQNDWVLPIKVTDHPASRHRQKVDTSLTIAAPWKSGKPCNHRCTVPESAPAVRHVL